MSEHTPTPWTFKDVPGAGLEIFSPVYQVTGVELPIGMPEAPIKTFILTGPQVVPVAAERWVQFEPKGWHDMQAANAAFIVKAVNSHDALVKALQGAMVVLESMPRPTAGLVSNQVQAAWDKRVAAVRDALALVGSPPAQK